MNVASQFSRLALLLAAALSAGALLIAQTTDPASAPSQAAPVAPADPAVAPASPTPQSPVPPLVAPQLSTPAPKASDPNDSGGYVLGPGDQLVIRALDADEISEKPVRIDTNGFIRLPMVGRLKAGGLTIEQLETELASRLESFLQQPEVSVNVTEFRSQPVAVIGAVKNPGVVQLQGRKTLIEMLSLAGGLDSTAGHSIKITRRREAGPIPLRNVVKDPSGEFTIAEVQLKSILNAQNPEENIVILPNDVISIPRAELIYVTGQVVRSGGFVLNENETLSVLQALALAGGLDKMASPKDGRILRASNGPNRLEIPVDLRKMMAGKADDVAMRPEDILFVPGNASKKAAVRAIEAAIQIGTGMVIWRR